MTSPQDALEARDLQEAQEQFARFARAEPQLPLYRAICQGLAADSDTAGLLLSAQPGQARAVLFLAALHDLVLHDRSVPAARWYPSVVGRAAVPRGDPWPDVRATILEHADELRRTIAMRRTQTNEVNRVVYLAPALALAARDVAAHPTVLVELGASAGLLLEVDRYRIELHRRGVTLVLGDPRSIVTCLGEDRSPEPLPDLVVPNITLRVGLDLAPIDLDDAASVRWLEACIWPDVPGRIERFRAAVELARQSPPLLRTGDLVGDLADTVRLALGGGGGPARHDGVHLIVFSSWALTYVRRDRRAEVGSVLAQVARSVPAVSWVTAEPVGCVPGLPLPPGVSEGDDATVLGARRWRAGRELPPEPWGTCHPHGAWVVLSGGGLSGGG